MVGLTLVSREHAHYLLYSEAKFMSSENSEKFTSYRIGDFYQSAFASTLNSPPASRVFQ